MEAIGHSIGKLHIFFLKMKWKHFHFYQEIIQSLIKEVLVGYIIESAGTRKSAETLEKTAGLLGSVVILQLPVMCLEHR